MLLTLCLIIIVLVWFINRWNFRAYVRLAYQVPSNKWHTFFGWGTIFRPKDAIKITNAQANKYGPNSILWMGPIPFFLTSDPDTIMSVFTSKNCINKPIHIMNGIEMNAGSGLLSANEPLWSQHRKVLNKSFSNKNLLSFFPIFHKEVNNTIKQIDRNLEKGDYIDMLDILRQLTLKITSRTILKRDLEQTKFKPATMSSYLNEILGYTFETCVNVLLKINYIKNLAEMFIYKKAIQGRETFREFINESWDILEKNDTNDSSYLSEVNSVLDYALIGVQQKKLKVEEISGQMMQLYFAAFETTSSTLFFALSMLAIYPEYQERAYKEVMDILSDNDEEVITLKKLNQLTYLEMILNETMRVLTPAPMVVREICNENLTLSNGLSLTVGQTVCIDIYSLHRNKKIWGPNADVFNPDNFLPANVAARHPFSFIPFTKGHRFCMGLKYAMLFLKYSLAKLIKTYAFSTDFKYKDFKCENHITLKLVEDPILHVERRVKLRT